MVVNEAVGAPVGAGTDACRTLAEAFASLGLHRPVRLNRYQVGDELTYDVTGVSPPVRATVRLKIEKFVGGGFAGQVYRATVLAVEGQPIAGLDVGGTYALKILLPPSPGKTRFRDTLYAVGFQGPFSLQVNPVAMRAGAIWQKLIRRASAIRFSDDGAVKDILCTFVDDRLGSCGELSEWVEGRQWRFEVDDHIDLRGKYVRGKPVEVAATGGRAGTADPSPVIAAQARPLPARAVRAEESPRDSAPSETSETQGGAGNRLKRFPARTIGRSDELLARRGR